jgi:hypothetical protein
MTIPDAIDRAGKHLQELSGGRALTREAIINETLRYGNWSPASIIPSDFCYNRTNKAARQPQYWIFLMVDPDRDTGLYRYVGRNYGYRGLVVTKPKFDQPATQTPARSATNAGAASSSAQSASTNSEVSVSEVRELWNTLDPECWKRALSRYWTFVKTSNLDLERELDQLDVGAVRRMSPEEWYRFLSEKYFRWKYTAPNRYASTTKILMNYEHNNTLPELHGIKTRLFAMDKNHVEQCLAVACSIKGIGTAGASGLLAILFPAYFGTVDQFAVKALIQVRELPERWLIQRIDPDAIKANEGAGLIRIMRRKAAQLNEAFGTIEWSPRKIDMVLWACAR